MNRCGGMVGHTVGRLILCVPCRWSAGFEKQRVHGSVRTIVDEEYRDHQVEHDELR